MKHEGIRTKITNQCERAISFGGVCFAIIYKIKFEFENVYSMLIEAAKGWNHRLKSC